MAIRSIIKHILEKMGRKVEQKKKKKTLQAHDLLILFSGSKNSSPLIRNY